MSIMSLPAPAELLNPLIAGQGLILLRVDPGLGSRYQVCFHSLSLSQFRSARALAATPRGKLGNTRN